MEKPRKKPLRDIVKGREKFCPENAEYNQGIDDMSTWLEGQVPTVEDIEKIITAVAMASHLENHRFPTPKEFSEEVHALIIRKLTGSGK